MKFSIGSEGLVVRRLFSGMRCRIPIALLLASALNAQATENVDRADLRLEDGTELQSARVVLISGDRVVIAHKSGMITVAPDLVPLDVLARAHDRLVIAERQRGTVAEEVAQRDSARRQSIAATLNLAPVPEAKPRLSQRMSLIATGATGPRTTPENGCVVAMNAGGRGTAFILRQSEGFVLVSNQHVIDGGSPHRFELAGGRTLKPYGGFLSTDRDIAVLDLEEPTFAQYFEMEPDVDAVALGEDVVIYGNSEGKGLRISSAKLVAKSPVQIEVSGGIVHGNSGGPIVRTKTGRVIAVSTSVRIRGRAKTISDLVEEVALPRVQFYGVRIDTLKKTASFDFGRFVAESVNLNADEQRIKDGVGLAALMLQSMTSRPDREIRKMAADASQSVRQLWSIARKEPLLFRQKAAQFVQPISPANSFIHAEKRERLMRSRDVLANAYRELIPGFGR